MGDAFFNVDAVQPWPGAKRIGGEVDEGSRIDEDRVAYARFVMRDPFGDASRGFDAPDIHRLGQRALDEVDEGLVGRP